MSDGYAIQRLPRLVSSDYPNRRTITLSSLHPPVRQRSSQALRHLGGYFVDGDRHTFTPDIWGYLLVKFDLRSVLDLGCGTGVNMKWFKEMGCQVLGVEGCQTAIAQARCSPIAQHDYTQGPYVPDEKFDLCLCTEFVEHVEQKFEDNWFATMKSCRYVLMSHAVPGQGGHHHVNEQLADYWVSRFRFHGFDYRHHDSILITQTNDRVRSPWGRPTLMLFERIDEL